MADWSPDLTPPKYGPPNMAAELYKMIRGIPQAYEEGQENRFKQGQRERTEQLQQPILGPDGQPSQDPMAISRELARRYPEKALEYPVQGLTTKATQEYFNNRNKEAPDFPGGSSPETRSDSTVPVLRQKNADSSFGPTDSVTDLVNRSPAQFSNIKTAAANIAKLYKVDPNEPLPPETAAGIKAMLARAGGQDNETPVPDEEATGAAPSGNVTPFQGLMGAAPPSGVLPTPGGPAPAAPPQQPGMPSGGRMVQAPLATAPGLAGGLQPFVQPPAAQAPQGQAPQGAGLKSQAEIDDMRNRATKLLREGQFVPAVAATNKIRAENLIKAADEAQKARDKVVTETHPAVIGAKEAEARGKEEATVRTKQYQGVVGLGDAADREFDKVKFAKRLANNPDFYSGPLAPTAKLYKQFQSNFGKPYSAVPMEAMDKIANDMLNQQIRALGQSGVGQVRVAEIRNLQRTIVSEKVTPETVRMLLNLVERNYKDAQEVRDMAADYKGGRLDAGFDKKLAEYYKTNHLIKPDEMKDMRLLAQPEFDSFAEAKRAGLKPGAVFLVNGKQHHVPEPKP